jgi:hypothetical protein
MLLPRGYQIQNIKYMLLPRGYQIQNTKYKIQNIKYTCHVKLRCGLLLAPWTVLFSKDHSRCCIVYNLYICYRTLLLLLLLLRPVIVSN